MGTCDGTHLCRLQWFMPLYLDCDEESVVREGCDAMVSMGYQDEDGL